jgi:hypothetical protein
MSAILVASIPGVIVGASPTAPSDVESDSLTAHAGTLNVNVPRTSPNSGFLTVEPFALPEASLAAPAAPTLASTAGGALGALTYYVKIAYLDQNMAPSLLSAEANEAVGANNLLVVDSPAAETNAVYFAVYASTATGTETLQSILPIGTNFTLPTTGLVAGAAMPNAETGLIDGPCTITITQGAGSLTIAPTQ